MTGLHSFHECKEIGCKDGDQKPELPGFGH